jgi:hypothetical protein
MVWSVCPLCGTGLHGLPNMTDTDAWYAKNHPDLKPHSVIPELCPECMHEYKVGEKIIRRDRTDKTIYTIASLLCRPNQPPLIIATTTGDYEHHFAIAQIMPFREERKIKDPNLKKIDGYF